MNQPSPQNPPQPPYLDYDDEIDLLELFSTLWQAKWKILGGGFSAALFVAIYSLFIPNEYQASALLSPAQGKQSGHSSQLSGLVGLAGISLPGGSQVDPTQIAVETLQSRKFLIDFIKRRNIASELVAATGYDREKNRWKYDRSRFDALTREWLEGEAPDEWELYKTLRDTLTVNFDDRKGLVTVKLSSYSPRAASEWLTLLVSDLNLHLMEKEVAEAERSIAYLQQKLQETVLTEMREVFYQLIEQQTRTIMLARAKPEYALATIDPALEPRDKASPKRTLMTVLASILGAMVMVTVTFIRQWVVNHARDVSELTKDAEGGRRRVS